MDSLEAFGWTPEFAHKWQALTANNLQPARVIADFGTSLKIAMPEVRAAELSGKLAHYSAREETPKVGDWVGVRPVEGERMVIELLVPRRSEFARNVAGKRTQKQIMAANIDIAFVLLALDADFSVERLSRYLYQLSTDNIKPVIVLNKADKTDRVEDYIEQLSSLQLPVIVSSAVKGDGVAEIAAHILPGQTAILLGSSGVGKSTLTNQLLGEQVQRTAAVRTSDSTGKHTTVHRELFGLPGGGMLIDSPGIRELQLWGTNEDLDENFDDITALANACKYTTCRHGSEEGCAVQAALRSGVLDAGHFANYIKMQRELVELKKKTQARAISENRKSRKNVNRQSGQTLKEIQDEMNYT
jgi:ribosome biogenesis GTPase